MLAKLWECYNVRCTEAWKAKKEGEPFYILQKVKYCNFPPKPYLEQIKAIKDETEDLFDSDEEVDGEKDESKVDNLYKNEPKKDSRQALSWDPDALHRIDEAIITNIHVLVSDDHIHNSCNDFNK